VGRRPGKHLRVATQLKERAQNGKENTRRERVDKGGGGEGEPAKGKSLPGSGKSIARGMKKKENKELARKKTRRGREETLRSGRPMA